MSELSIERIVNVSISRETTAVTRAAFGTPAVIAMFATNKTTTTFDRFRTYSSLTEMSDDGWIVSDPVYKAGQLVFSQNPKVSNFMVGRKDANDATWAAALNAIQLASPDWYTFGAIIPLTTTLTFSEDFVASNSIVFTINGVALTAIAYNTSNAQTYTDIKTGIEAQVAGAQVTVNATNRTVAIYIPNQYGCLTASVVVSGGVSQPTATATNDLNSQYTSIAAWTETQKKLFILSSGDVEMYNAGSTTDIAYTIKAAAYDRTITCFRASFPDYFEYGWIGETLPYNPGSQTWANKTIAGITTDTLTSGRANVLDAKNCNYYVTIGGVNVTQTGKVASGEWIDIMRGIDWLESEMEANVFTAVVNKRKISYTDQGITIVANAVQATLEDAVDNDVLASYTMSVPKASEISAADKANRVLNNLSFDGVLSGAIHKAVIQGTVSY